VALAGDLDLEAASHVPAVLTGDGGSEPHGPSVGDRRRVMCPERSRVARVVDPRLGPRGETRPRRVAPIDVLGSELAPAVRLAAPAKRTIADRILRSPQPISGFCHGAAPVIPVESIGSGPLGVRITTHNTAQQGATANSNRCCRALRVAEDLHHHSSANP
jgi:hypothetical protein